jgi:signal transduction histidine kinase
VNKEAQRLEQFSDDIAHEIKNRLFEILSTLDLALTAPHPKEGIEKAKTIVKQLSGVVDALLFFARNEMPSPEEYNLSDLLKNELNFDDPRIQYL